MHYEEACILSQIQSMGSLTVTLFKGDSAWNPTTTSGRPIYGPAKITYTRYADGGIHCQFDEIAVANNVGLSGTGAVL